MIDHYFSKKQTTPSRKQDIVVRARGHEIRFTTDRGTFSPEHADTGSLLLLETADIKDGMEVLDLGCGWGLVGIALAKDKKIELTMTDVNGRSVGCTEDNAKKNGIKATVLQSDGFEKIMDKKFDRILFNPPFSAGKEVWVPILKEAIHHLKTGAMIDVVGRHNKGGRDLENIMLEIFGNVEAASRQSGFRVYRSLFKKE